MQINPVERKKQVIRRLSARRRLKILVVSSRENHFDPDMFTSFFELEGFEVRFLNDVHRVGELGEKFDVLLMLTHWRNEVRQLQWAKEHHLADLYVTWMWDNHIPKAYEFHRRIVRLSDVYFTAHSIYADVYKTPLSIHGGHHFLSSVQWDEGVVTYGFERHGLAPRSNQLYGPYFAYPEYPERDRLLRALIDRTNSAGLRLREANEDNRDSYFGLDKLDRFREWMSYKVSIALPLHKDLSSRVFDALLAGQIPLVPHDTIDLDSVVSAEEQRMLPIIRLPTLDPEGAFSAYHDALLRFDAEGGAGAMRRHLFALKGHIGRHRFRSLFERIQSLIHAEAQSYSLRDRTHQLANGHAVEGVDVPVVDARQPALDTDAPAMSDQAEQPAE